MSESSRLPIQGLAAKTLGLSLLIFSFVHPAAGADRKAIAAYDQAMSAYKAGSYEQALKNLDQLETFDIAPCDRAESLNLRAVILMREADYPAAESRLRSALELAPSMANAKFNLGKISFLKRDWTDARKRFEQLLTDDHAGVENDVGELIQFKIFLTLLLDREKDEAARLMHQWQQTAPAAYYAHVAIAKDHADGAEAKKWQDAAMTKFGEAINQLYAESFYELGWDERPATQPPPKFEISTAAERDRRLELAARDILAKTEVTAHAASLDEMPENKGPSEMLGLALCNSQKQLPETELPSYRVFADLPGPLEAGGGKHSTPYLEVQRASQTRGELEKLFAAADSPRSRQFILYKVFLTFMLEGADYQAEFLMQRFSYTDETPVLYYAHGAWAFEHGDFASGHDWIQLAARIYSAELNALFLDDFYRLHWLDPNVNQISSTRIAIGTPLSSTLPVQAPQIASTILPAAGSNPDPVSQTLPER